MSKEWQGYELIFKKSDTLFYSYNHQLFAKYHLKDTLRLNEQYFKIDSFSANPSKLIISKIKGDLKLFGFRTSETSRNYIINDLNGNSTTLKELAEKKGFLILDFWGTWCGPCKDCLLYTSPSPRDA